MQLLQPRAGQQSEGRRYRPGEPGKGLLAGQGSGRAAAQRSCAETGEGVRGAAGSDAVQSQEERESCAAHPRAQEGFGQGARTVWML